MGETPTSFQIELPLPPTANNAYPTGASGRRYLSKRGRAWKTEAGWLIKDARAPKFTGSYRFHIAVPLKARGDADGYIKLAQDAMADVGVTPNDRKAISSHADRSAFVPQGRCIISIHSG